MKDMAVEEIRARRRKLLKEQYGGSIKQFIDEAIKWQKAHPDCVVDLSKHRHSEVTKK